MTFKRIFIAVNLPEKIREELEETEKNIQSLFPESEGRGVVKWVKKENLHITLLFIGSVREKEIGRIEEILEGITKKKQPFRLSGGTIGYGPENKFPPRLIWLSLKESPDLSGIAKEIREKIEKTGIAGGTNNRQKFLPHITLGRINVWQWKRIELEERPIVEKNIDINFPLNSVELMESQLKRGGAEYMVLRSYGLGR